MANAKPAAKTAVKKEPTVVKEEKWVQKDRIYILKNGATPVHFILRSKHSTSKPLQFFDGTKQRALRYASNQESLFVDEQYGDVTLPAIIFENGKLDVRAEQVALQQFLSIYHPDRNSVFVEFDPESIAENEMKNLDLELDAMNMARDMDISDLEAIARVVLRGRVSNMKASEIRRDMVQHARRNPQEFISLANDENIKLRNLAVRAVEEGFMKVLDDAVTVVWRDNGEKVITAPWGENVYSALAKYFKTEEGINTMQALMNKL